MLGVVAARVQLRPLGGIVQVGEARVVELQIGASEGRDSGDLLRVRRAQVIPELVDRRIHRRVDRCRAAPVVHHARRGDRELRREPCRLLQEREVVREDRLTDIDPVVDLQGRRFEGDLLLLVAHLDAEVVVALPDATELVDEVHVPRGAAELTVGRGLEPDVLLHPHDVADRVVLDRAQLRRGDTPRGGFLASAEHRLRAEQAADVVGSKRRDESGHRGTICRGVGLAQRRLAQDVALSDVALGRRPTADALTAGPDRGAERLGAGGGGRLGVGGRLGHVGSCDVDIVVAVIVVVTAASGKGHDSGERHEAGEDTSCIEFASSQSIPLTRRCPYMTSVARSLRPGYRGTALRGNCPHR